MCAQSATKPSTTVILEDHTDKETACSIRSSKSSKCDMFKAEFFSAWLPGAADPEEWNDGKDFQCLVLGKHPRGCFLYINAVSLHKHVRKTESLREGEREREKGKTNPCAQQHKHTHKTQNADGKDLHFTGCAARLLKQQPVFYLRCGEEGAWRWYSWKGERVHYLFFFFF